MALRADDVDFCRDRALVVRFQSGDDAAFDDLYRRYFARLRRFCERRVGDPHEAEELAQEAFVRALRAMPDFAGERRFYPWMTVIASRLCVDSHRRRERSTPVAEIDLGSVEADIDELFAAVDRAHLAEALDRLAPRHREVLDLRERDGWSYQRIADHYDVTLGTVEALLHRARRALRREFEKVTGHDRLGALAGVPAVGWLLRRAHSLRLRVAQLGDLATPLSATVASVALAAGSAVVLDAGHAAPLPVAAPHVVTVDGSQLASSNTTASPLAAPTPPAISFDGASQRASSSATHGTTGWSAAVAPGVQLADADAGKQRADAAPVSGGIDGVAGIGVDPSAIVTDVAHDVGDLLRRLP